MLRSKTGRRTSTQEERKYAVQMLSSGLGTSSVAQRLNRDVSTISRWANSILKDSTNTSLKNPFSSRMGKHFSIFDCPICFEKSVNSKHISSKHHWRIADFLTSWGVYDKVTGRNVCSYKCKRCKTFRSDNVLSAIQHCLSVHNPIDDEQRKEVLPYKEPVISMKTFDPYPVINHLSSEKRRLEEDIESQRIAFEDVIDSLRLQVEQFTRENNSLMRDLDKATAPTELTEDSRKEIDRFDTWLENNSSRK